MQQSSAKNKRFKQEPPQLATAQIIVWLAKNLFTLALQTWAELLLLLPAIHRNGIRIP